MGLNVAIVFITFILMEGLAWGTHKYIMHGFMWRWHHSHHNHHAGFLEKNDLFSVVFSVFAVATVMIGLNSERLWFLAPIGIGITVYGVFYFLFHDVIVHRRVKIKFNATHPYMKRIIRAHYVHHKVHKKEGAEAFGFLYAPKKYDRKP